VRWQYGRLRHNSERPPSRRWNPAAGALDASRTVAASPTPAILQSLRQRAPVADADRWSPWPHPPVDEQPVRDDAAPRDMYAVTATSPYPEHAELPGPLDARASAADTMVTRRQPSQIPGISEGLTDRRSPVRVPAR
jgi:hypothetical protein